MTDTIDKDELERRKKAARGQAAAEHETLSALEKAYSAYTAATAARVAAEQALETAHKAEDEAASKVEEAVWWCGPFPSGVWGGYDAHAQYQPRRRVGGVLYSVSDDGNWVWNGEAWLHRSAIAGSSS